MRNKIFGIEGRKKMTTAIVNTAKGMAEYLLSKEHRGPGDTIEAAAFRLQTRLGVSTTLLMRMRHRDVNDMLMSNFFMLAYAYTAFKKCNEAMERAEKRADEAYRHEKALAIDPKIVRMAAALAGEKGEA